MQKIALFALALSLVAQAAPAAPSHDKAYRRGAALLARLKAHPKKKINALAAPLLNFSSSPSVPTQGKDLTWVIQFDNPFSNRDLSIDLTLNGAPVTNIQSPFKGMFVVDLGVQNTAGAANLVATLFADDTSTHTDIRAAVSALDTSIKRLTSQINAERNPVNRANLQEQRGEDVAMKNELLTELRAYRYNLGTQAQAFTVKPDSSSTTLPTITGVAPVAGDVRGGTIVTITGTNFSSNAAVLFGGIASPSVTFVSATQLQAVTPDFGTATGAKDVEARFTANGATTNVVSPGAYFAENTTFAPSQNPVAIASGSTHIHLGDATLLDGTESFGGPDPLTYAWSVVSAPASSEYFVGQTIGSTVSVNVAPTTEGTYVFQLIVNSGALASAPSIAVVQVDGSPNPTAGPIQVMQGLSGTTQVAANDPIPGDTVTYAISGGVLHGTADISTSGLLTYTPVAGFLGADSVVVLVTGQSGLSASLVIPVVVYAPNHAPTAFAPAITVSTSAFGTSQVSATDPDGQSISYSIITAPTMGTASVSSSGLVTYTGTMHTTGTDSVTVRVSDNGFPVMHTDVVIPVILPNHAPVASAPPITVKPGIAGTSQINAFDRDLNQTVSYAIGTPPANGTATLSSSGVVSYTSSAGYTGNDSIVVTVSDNGTPVQSKSVTIPVVVSNLNPPSLPPLVGRRVFLGNAPYQIGIGFNTSTSQTITDGNGGIANVVSDFGDGTREFVSDKLYAGVLHNYVDPGDYVATLIVTDVAGLTSSASFPVHVADQEIPVARFTMSPSTGGQTPLTVTFDASASTHSAGIGEYRWLFCGSNPEVVTTTPTVTHTFTGSCSVRLRAVANGTVGGLNLTGQTSATVPVAAGPGTFPTSQYTVLPSREVLSGTLLSFDSSRSIDPNVGGSITSYHWNFGDFQCNPACTANGVSASHTYNYVGSSFPTVVVQNAVGLSSLAASVQVSTIVRAGTHAPRSILTASSLRGVAPFTVNFDASQSYAFDGASITGYNVNFGDSASTTAPVSSHTYSSSGTYFVSSVVQDSDGNITSASQTITVTATRDQLASSRDDVPVDPDREYQRSMLAGACSGGDGAACYGLARMYSEDGDAYTADQLRSRACTLGYAAACGR